MRHVINSSEKVLKILATDLLKILFWSSFLSLSSGSSPWDWMSSSDV